MDESEIILRISVLSQIADALSLLVLNEEEKESYERIISRISEYKSMLNTDRLIAKLKPAIQKSHSQSGSKDNDRRFKCVREKVSLKF